jgi:hypothetical protein
MHQTCMYGSERGARGNLRPYRDRGPSVRYRSASAVAPGVEGEEVPAADSCSATKCANELVHFPQLMGSAP